MRQQKIQGFPLLSLTDTLQHSQYIQLPRHPIPVVLLHHLMTAAKSLPLRGIIRIGNRTQGVWIQVIRRQFHGAAANRVDLTVCQAAWNTVLNPFAPVLSVSRHFRPTIAGRPRTLVGFRPPLGGRHDVLLHPELVPVAPGQDRISMIGSQFGQALMPVLGITSGLRISGRSDDSISSDDLPDVVEKQRLDTLQHGTLSIFGRVEAVYLGLRDHRASSTEWEGGTTAAQFYAEPRMASASISTRQPGTASGAQTVVLAGRAAPQRALSAPDTAATSAGSGT